MTKNTKKSFGSAARRAAPPPAWDLSDFGYGALDSEEIETAKEEYEKKAKEFADYYEEWISTLSGAELGEAIREYEELSTPWHNMMLYAGLKEMESGANAAKAKELQGWLEEAGSSTTFFEKEIRAMDESVLMTKLSDPALSTYAPWIAYIRADRAYKVSEVI